MFDFNYNFKITFEDNSKTECITSDKAIQQIVDDEEKNTGKKVKKIVITNDRKKEKEVYFKNDDKYYKLIDGEKVLCVFTKKRGF